MSHFSFEEVEDELNLENEFKLKLEKEINSVL